MDKKLIEIHKILIPTKLTIIQYTVNGERFAGLGIRGFGPLKLSREYFCGALAISVYFLTIAN